MSDGIGCFMILAGVALLLFVIVALGFCGAEHAQQAKELIGR